MVLICRNCGRRNRDPGGDPGRYNCGYCGRGPLVRLGVNPDEAKGVAGAVLGAAIGGALGGPPGAIFGAILGAIAGSDQKKGRK